MNLRDNFKSVFDSDYCGAEEFIAKVIKPIFGEKDVEVMEPCIDNPTNADEDILKKANIEEILWVAQVDRMGTDPIQVFDVTLGDNTNLSRARVGIQRIIRSALFPYSHAFIIFHHRVLSGTEWRFSYVYKKDKNANTTDAKRYTYLFSRELHARTAIDRFEELANSSKDDEALQAAFNVEALSDEFFDKYRSYYAELVKYITGKEYVKDGGKYVEKNTGKPDAKLYAAFGKDDKAVRDYVKKLMGRITFLHFLQRKGWMNSDKNYMLHLFENSKHKADYMDKVLEPLFFGILNTKIEDRYSLFKKSGWDMNLLDEWKSIPYLNGGLFEQEPFDCNNSIFPKDFFARLFQFFSEYNFTVDENDPDDAEVGVDPEMLGKIFENLLEDNKDKGAFYTPKEIVRYMCRESLISYLLGKTGIDEVLIRDFVTSPYEKEEQMEWADKETILAALENVKICDPAIGSGAFPMGLLNELVRCEEAIVLGQEKNKGRADLKKAIIKNNIYGVDIEKGAIDIARLRFWLSLVVDEVEAAPLPNLDYKIMQGNSLLESYKGVDLSHILDVREGELNFGADTRADLKEKLDLYYTCEDHEKKKQLQSEINELVHQQVSESGGIDKSFEHIDVSGNQEFFLWHTWFSDVFNREENGIKQNGFDIVIGNPPYISIQGMPEAMRRLYKSVFKFFFHRYDIFGCFIEEGLNLLCKDGILTFIQPSVFLNSKSFTYCREFIVKECSLLRINLLKDGVFDSAIVPTMIMSVANRHPANQEIRCSQGSLTQDYIVEQNYFNKTEANVFNINLDKRTASFIEKTESNCLLLGDIARVSNGINTGNLSAYIHDRKLPKTVPVIKGGSISKWTYEFNGMYLDNCFSEFVSCGDLDAIKGEKLMMKRIGIVPNVCYDDQGMACLHTIHTIRIVDKRFDPKYVMAILNSKLIAKVFRLRVPLKGDVFPEFRVFDLNQQMPIYKASTSQQKTIITIVDRIMSAVSDAERINLEAELDKCVYQLYGLTEDDIALVES